MFRDLDITYAPKYFFYVVYLAKKTAFALILVYFYESKYTSHNFVMVFACILPMIYMCYYRPFTLKLTNIHMIYNEMNEVFVVDQIINFTDPYLTDFEFFTYAKSVIGDIVIWIMISFIIFLFSLIKKPKCCPQRKPPIVYKPKYPEEMIIEVDSPLSEESDWEMPAAFVKVNEVKEGMEGSSDDKE
jgi:hypothetical protein